MLLNLFKRFISLSVIDYVSLWFFFLFENLEEEQKRMNEELAPEGTYHAVGFTYGQREPESSEEYQLVDQPQMLEHPPSSYVDIVDEGGEYERPFRLFIPPNIRTVSYTYR